MLNSSGDGQHHRRGRLARRCWQAWAGVWPDVDTACNTAISVTGSTQPNPEAVAQYETLSQYRSLYPALKPTFDALSAAG